MRIMMTRRRNRGQKSDMEMWPLVVIVVLRNKFDSLLSIQRATQEIDSLLSIQRATQDSFILPTVSEITDLAFVT